MAARRAFYDALPGTFSIPAVKIEVDTSRQDKQARGVEILGRAHHPRTPAIEQSARELARKL